MSFVFVDASSTVTVIEMIEIAIGRTTRIGCERKRDANANTSPRRIEIVTNDTRDVRWSGKRVGRAQVHTRRNPEAILKIICRQNEVRRRRKKITRKRWKRRRRRRK